MDPMNGATITEATQDNGYVKHYIAKASDEISIKSVSPGSVPLDLFYSNTLKGDYEAAGTGLAETGAGTINIANIPNQSSIEAAFLFWDVIRFGGSNVPIIPNGTLNGHPIEGTLIGTDDEGFPIDGFYADVTSYATFGSNSLSDFPTGAAYQTDGASLVVIYSNPTLPLKTVVINDGLVVFNNDTASTTLNNFKAGSSPTMAKTTYMAGQVSYGDDEAYFNGATVGTGVFNSLSDPFWTNYNADVSAHVNPGDTSAEAVISNNQNNVLIWVAQAFSVNAEVPTRGIDISKFGQDLI